MTPPTLLHLFREWLGQNRDLSFADYEALHRWSVDSQADFWSAVWAFDGVLSPEPHGAVLSSAQMPGAEWFPGTQVNYARQVFRHVTAAEQADQPALIAEDERGPIETLGWAELKRRVASLALEYRRLGIVSGDRIAAYLPNRPEAVVAFLAAASIGAVWTICAPDMGVPAILDRFQQIEPKLMIATDGAYYAGRELDRSDVVAELLAGLPGLEHVMLVPSGFARQDFPLALSFADATARDDAEVAAFEPEWVAFDHPLWILFSSGTTGRPKGLVHGHGGIVMAAAATRLNWDLGASYDPRTPNERLHWFTSTGWMMWNSQISGLLSGTTVCIFDGSPAGSRDAPDWSTLWRFVARNRVTFFGSGAQFFSACIKERLDFATVGDLSPLRGLGSTASPLPAEVQNAVGDRLAAIGKPDLWWLNISGGTDICGAFCTGNRELPPTPGKLQCRQLGVAVEAWDEDGQSVVDQVGELVCVKPLPSMPLYLWNDADGARYRDSYFDKYPGIWRHGDWLRIEAGGTCEIFGRSDATINRGGHRMGTSEIYAAIERLEAVADSLIIDVRSPQGDSQLLLFVVPTGDAPLSNALEAEIKQAIRVSLSPRFLPDRIFRVTSVPRTLSSKKQELPMKRLFEGWDLDKIIDRSTMANPESLKEFVGLAGEFQGVVLPGAG